MCQCKDRSLNPQDPYQRLNITGCVYNLSLERSKRQACSGTPLASQPSPNDYLGVQKKAASRPYGRELKKPSVCLLLYLHGDTRFHTSMYAQHTHIQLIAYTCTPPPTHGLTTFLWVTSSSFPCVWYFFFRDSFYLLSEIFFFFTVLCFLDFVFLLLFCMCIFLIFASHTFLNFLILMNSVFH